MKYLLILIVLGLYGCSTQDVRVRVKDCETIGDNLYECKKVEVQHPDQPLDRSGVYRKF